MRRAQIVLAVLMICAALGAGPARAATNPNLPDLVSYLGYEFLSSPPPELISGEPSPIYPHTLVAKAQPDECFDSLLTPPDFHSNPPKTPPCPSGSHSKTNQAYIWGLTQTGGNLWFGTIANTDCVVIGGMLSILVGSNPPPFDVGSWVCEYGTSYESQNGTLLPGNLGDFRPPHLYRYDVVTQALTDISPTSGPGADLLAHTTGIRSAGTLDGVVIFSGPALDNPGTTNFFAYLASNGSFLGSTSSNLYSDLRSWVVADGHLYAAVGLSAGGGAVIEWTGNAYHPFEFQTVGTLVNRGAYIAQFEGRLFVTTWPEVPGPTYASRRAQLYMSPTLPTSGGLPESTDPWTSVWNIDDYEIDPVVASATAGGALAAYDGKLYWGTMAVPFLSTEEALILGTAYENNPSCTTCLNLEGGDGTFGIDDAATTALGTYRAIAIFRGSNFDSSPNIELLYGEQYLPKYEKSAESYTIAPDTDHENAMHVAPEFGTGGFGNPFNAYTWSMAVYQNHLFVGTFDWSILPVTVIADLIAPSSTPLASSRLESALRSHVSPSTGEPDLTQALVNGAQQLATNIPSITIADASALRSRSAPIARPTSHGEGVLSLPTALTKYLGADLYRFDNSTERAQPESIAGVGNFTNYGIRNMVVADRLYLGTANPLNLLTGPSDVALFDTSAVPTGPAAAHQPDLIRTDTGGWELIALGSQPITETPTVSPTGLAILALLLLGAALALVGRMRG